MPSTNLVESRFTPIKQRHAAKPKPTMGDAVMALRALAGSARRRAEAELIKRSAGFVLRCAHPYFGDDLDREDVLATANLGLAEAMSSWDPAKGMFHVHAKWKIYGALAKLLRRSRLVRGSTKYSAVPLKEVDDASSAVGAEAETDLAAAEARREVAAALASMPARFAALVREELRGETVDQADREALREAKDLLGETVLRLRRRRSTAATPMGSRPKN